MLPSHLPSLASYLPTMEPVSPVEGIFFLLRIFGLISLSSPPISSLFVSSHYLANSGAAEKEKIPFSSLRFAIITRNLSIMGAHGLFILDPG